MNSNPTELDQVNRQLMRLEVEEAALKKETDDASVKRLADVQRELASAKEKQRALSERWDSEKKSLQALSAQKVER